MNSMPNTHEPPTDDIAKDSIPLSVAVRKFLGLRSNATTVEMVDELTQADNIISFAIKSSDFERANDRIFKVEEMNRVLRRQQLKLLRAISGLSRVSIELSKSNSPDELRDPDRCWPDQEDDAPHNPIREYREG